MLEAPRAVMRSVPSAIEYSSKGSPRLIQALGALSRRLLSQGTFDFVRLRYWEISSYFPRLVSSRFTEQRPVVQGFPESSSLAAQLRSVNVLAPTALCRAMTAHRS